MFDGMRSRASSDQVVEAFRCEALADLPDARLEEDFAELQRAEELL
jgi:hypothetical protein